MFNILAPEAKYCIPGMQEEQTEKNNNAGLIPPKFDSNM
jgi:hypothetical protein